MKSFSKYVSVLALICSNACLAISSDTFLNDASVSYALSKYHTTDIDHTRVYGGLPMVPVVHPYTNQYSLSIHTGGKIPYSNPPLNEMVASPNNMQITGVDSQNSSVFWGFYKGINRSVTGAVKNTSLADDRGVIVLHVLLSSEDYDDLESEINKHTVKIADIRGVLEKPTFKDKKWAEVTKEVLSVIS